jgi:hypothetical protein
MDGGKVALLGGVTTVIHSKDSIEGKRVAFFSTHGRTRALMRSYLEEVGAIPHALAGLEELADTGQRIDAVVLVADGYEGPKLANCFRTLPRSTAGIVIVTHDNVMACDECGTCVAFARPPAWLAALRCFADGAFHMTTRANRLGDGDSDTELPFTD